MKKTKSEKYLENFTGVLTRQPDGDMIVIRQGKSGKWQRYKMHVHRGDRTSKQIMNCCHFRKTNCITNVQLKTCYGKWKSSYEADGGMVNGKHYVTLRGYVFASIYQVAVETEESGGEFTRKHPHETL